MNTLNTSTLHNIQVQPSIELKNRVLNKEQYLNFRTAFKALAADKHVTAIDIVLYNIIRGYSVDRGFTPITNHIKLIKGQHPRGALIHACNMLRSQFRWQFNSLNTRFNNFISTEEEKTAILQILLNAVNQ